MAKSPNLSRSDFVKFMVGVLGSIMGAIVGLPAIGYILAPAMNKQETDAWVSLGKVEDFPVGVPTLRTFTRTKVNGWERTVNSYGVFVVRKSEVEGDIDVISNVCTHLSCRVNWKEDVQEFICPCHDQRFGLLGEMISGPAPRALDKFSEVKIEEGLLSMHFVEGK